MIVDLGEASGGVLDTDLCIVGSGPAMVAFVHRWLSNNPKDKSLRIAIFESSAEFSREFRHSPGSAYDSDVQHLYNGTVRGWISKTQPNYLQSSRLRALGGSTNVWSGWCWPIDRVNFEARPSYRKHHWSIDYNELNLYHQVCHEFLNLGRFDYNETTHYNDILGLDPNNKIEKGHSIFRSRILKFNRTNVFRNHIKQFLESDSVTLFLNANCLDVEVQGNQVTAVNIASRLRNGRLQHRRVRARSYIVMAGALESCRILLSSSLAPRLSALGKNFYEHPYLWFAGRIDINRASAGIRALYMTPKPHFENESTGFVGAIVGNEDFLGSHSVSNFRILLGGQENIPGTLNLSWETKPNEHGWLSLADDDDELGVKSIVLNSHLHADDKTSLARIMKESCRFLNEEYRLKVVETPNLLEPPESWNEPHRIVPGNHPMGVTIMGDSSGNSVVDSNLKVHGIENLYTCSTGVYPCGGYENPTLTLGALAMRLSDHLRKFY